MRRAREARRPLRRADLLFNCRAAQISPILRASPACYSILTGQIEKFSQADKLAVPDRELSSDFYLVLRV